MGMIFFTVVGRAPMTTIRVDSRTASLIEWVTSTVVMPSSR